jgi:DNA replication protein DnaC
LLTEELAVRNTNSLQKRMKRAGFPENKTLEQFDFGFQQSVSKQQILGLMDMCWVERAFNIFFLGPSSIGNYEKILLMERNEVVTSKISGRSFISFHNI